ncbi:MAG: hypothetical protein NZ534_06990, partial [Bacteroidia bacterium]|nr:hypothetical protein [Bacteroidia bacterium]
VLAGDVLAVEEKGTLSVEKFLMARRLMYWQVYHHKTCMAAETMLRLIFRRAREVRESLRHCPANLAYLLSLPESATLDERTLDVFLQTDDSDVLCALKLWQYETDPVLSRLCRKLHARRLYKSVRVESPQGPSDYRCVYKTVSITPYTQDEIRILTKNGEVRPFSQICDLSDDFNKTVSKTYKIYDPDEIQTSESEYV